MGILQLRPITVITVTNTLGPLLMVTDTPALAMAAEARGQLNPVFTDLDSTDTVLEFTEPALLDTPPVPLTPIEVSKASGENVMLKLEFMVMAISDTDTVSLLAMLTSDTVTITWERERLILNLITVMVVSMAVSTAGVTMVVMAVMVMAVMVT